MNLTIADWLVVATVLGFVLVLARMLVQRDREKAREDQAVRDSSRCAACGRSDKP